MRILGGKYQKNENIFEQWCEYISNRALITHEIQINLREDYFKEHITWDILKLAFWRGIRAIIVGLPFGLFLAWILSKVLSSFLVQVNVNDPLAWVISCAILLVITTVAALIPALRAIRVNPLDAMRNE